ncbi:hypothetical protein BH23ACT9_BH23ACT9_14720 [soil metagenome]
MIEEPVPCRRNCAMACLVDEWSGYLLNDLADFNAGARLGFLISWGRIPLTSWPDALELVERIYGRSAVLDALRWLAKCPLSRQFTEDHRMRVQAILTRYAGNYA